MKILFILSIALCSLVGATQTKADPIQIGQMLLTTTTVQRNSIGIVIDGTVKNVGPTPKQFIRIEATGFDGQNVIIDSNFTYATAFRWLQPNEVAHWHIQLTDFDRLMTSYEVKLPEEISASGINQQ